MKAMSAELKAHYASGTTTLCRLWKITRRDGLTFGFTDHDEPIEYLGQNYSVSSVFDASAVQTSAELNVDSASATGILATDGVTAADIEAGLWDGAKIELLEVNWADLSMGDNVLRVGDVGEISRNGKQYVGEMRGLMQPLQNTIVRVVNASCDADFGDARCGVDRESLSLIGTVVTVTSNRQFTATFSGAIDDDTYGLGQITWTFGLNDGLSMEMKSLATGEVQLQLDMPYTVAPGDEFTIVPGCNKIGREGHCKLVYDNLLNFRGFEDIPGMNKILQVGGQ